MKKDNKIEAQITAEESLTAADIVQISFEEEPL
jgi:hypothetical protein